MQLNLYRYQQIRNNLFYFGNKLPATKLQQMLVFVALRLLSSQYMHQDAIVATTNNRTAMDSVAITISV